MNGPGKILQQARKKKRYSIDKIHKATKIKQEYIDALENDQPSAFPAELYYKNFLKSYAQFLALDPNEILKLYEQAKLEQQEDLFKQNNNKIENKFIEFFNNNKNLFIYIGYGIIFILLIYVILLFIPNKKETSTTTNDIIISTSTTVMPTAIAQQQIKQKLYIKALANTWVQIVSDNKKVFEGTITKSFESKANEEFVVKIGNVDTVQVFFNDEKIDISSKNSTNKVKTITLKRK